MKQDSTVRKFFALLSVDFYKLFRSVSFYVVFGVLAVIEFFNILLMYAVNLLVSDYPLESLTHVNMLFGNSLSYGNLGLFLVIFFAIFLCSEFRGNTIRNKITMGYSRTQVYFASLTFTYLVTLMAVALSCAVVAIFGIPMLGWEHSQAAMEYAFYALFALLPLVALIHTLSYGSKSFGIALGVGLPLIIILPGILSMLNLFVYEYEWVEWLTRIIFISLEEYIPVSFQLEGMAMSHLALNATLSYTLWTALFIVIGYFAFTKQDIK